MEKMTIGQLAKMVGVNIETIRFYERRGILPQPVRNEAGHRQYSQDTIMRTRFIKRTQALGFSLKEISELLSLRIEMGTTCADVKTRIDAKVMDVENKIADLKQIREALLKLSGQCKGKGPISMCPILEALNNY